MKKKVILILVIVATISVIYFLNRSNKNDSYKNIINLFDNVKDENYLGYFFRYPNLNIKDLDNKVKLSMIINELYLSNKKDEYLEEEVKKTYKYLY